MIRAILAVVAAVAVSTCGGCSGAQQCAPPTTPGLDSAMADCLMAGGAFAGCVSTVAAHNGASETQVNQAWAGHISAEIKEGFVPRQYVATQVDAGGQ